MLHLIQLVPTGIYRILNTVLLVVICFLNVYSKILRLVLIFRTVFLGRYFRKISVPVVLSYLVLEVRAVPVAVLLFIQRNVFRV
jgi:hypothetical protein